MRREFFAIVDRGGDGLLPLVIAAAGKVNRPEPVVQPAA